MDNSPTTGSVNTSVAEKQGLAKSSLAFNCKKWVPLPPKTVSDNSEKLIREQYSIYMLCFSLFSNCCGSATFRKLFPEYVEKYSQQQVAEEEAATQQTTPEDSPQEENAKIESEKSIGLKKESIQEVGLKERRKNKKEALPGWIVLLLVSIVGVVMALPLLQLWFRCKCNAAQHDCKWIW